MKKVLNVTLGAAAALTVLLWTMILILPIGLIYLAIWVKRQAGLLTSHQLNKHG